MEWVCIEERFSALMTMRVNCTFRIFFLEMSKLRAYFFVPSSKKYISNLHKTNINYKQILMGVRLQICPARSTRAYFDKLQRSFI